MSAILRDSATALRRFSIREPAAAFSVYLSIFGLAVFTAATAYRRKHDTRERPEHRWFFGLPEEIVLHPVPKKTYVDPVWNPKTQTFEKGVRKEYKVPEGEPTLVSYFASKK
eukprot:TRINITY_DN3035_c1_g1_i1.p1 TRINITY_DN3035_c1_g1~~TRINITY_DN3035_c1_g1_i1.p1  ORF type:complete len:112 (-),score=29.61 TRINITY_DN3035_c1_g1_i1:189-524(-)